MNFSAHADPEPDLLLAILRHISLIEHKKESRRQVLAFFFGLVDRSDVLMGERYDELRFGLLPCVGWRHAFVSLSRVLLDDAHCGGGGGGGRAANKTAI